MAKLAIRGHATRGKEVIEILEMLGGKTNAVLQGYLTHRGYYIKSDGFIDYKYHSVFNNDILYSLEEFLEKFPYKVWDKVQHKGATSCGTVYVIEHMNWVNNHIEYEISPLHDYNHVGLLTVFVEDLQPYKEQETLATANNAVFNVNAQCCDIMSHLIKEDTMKEEVKLDIPEGYEFFGVDDEKRQVVFTKIGSHYPKTYEECCDVLDIQSDWHLTFELNNPATCDLCVNKEFEYVCKLEAFRKLLICRDAYWKIAGEEMGLGKPWEPDWLNTEQDKFVLYTHNNVICLNRFVLGHNVLAFPTAEMCDAFLENFKDLIEDCKELL